MTMGRRQRPQNNVSSKSVRFSWYGTGKGVEGGDLDGKIFKGFFADDDADDQFNAACEQAGVPAGQLSHRDGMRSHWLFEALAKKPTLVHPMISGLPYAQVGAMTRRWQETAEFGIMARWPQKQPTDTFKPRSRVGIKLLPAITLPYYMQPIALVVSGKTHTEALLDILNRHALILDVADAVLARIMEGQPTDPFQFCELAIPIGSGPAISAGAGTDITQVIPMTCLHPQEYIDLAGDTPDQCSENVAKLTKEQVDKIWGYISRLLAPDGIDLRAIMADENARLIEWAKSFSVNPNSDQFEETAAAR